jgi:hypothetical protein
MRMLNSGHSIRVWEKVLKRPTGWCADQDHLSVRHIRSLLGYVHSSMGPFAARLLHSLSGNLNRGTVEIRGSGYEVYGQPRLPGKVSDPTIGSHARWRDRPQQHRVAWGFSAHVVRPS